MNTVVKIIISIVLFLLGIFCAGAPIPYFPGRIILKMSLFAAAMIGIGEVWKRRPVKGEGDVFKNKDKLNKD
jgi:hypothetical protein